MNYKLNSYLSILAIACAVAVPLLSATARELPVHASLTAPADYDYGYIWSGSVQQYVSANGSSPTSIALFTRTADSIYYNYSHTFSNSGSHSNTANFDLPDGLDITMTFNRSNTSWTDASPTYTGYYPTENKIGSNSSVGSKIGKVDLIFDNQTNKNYRLYIDTTSMTQVFTNYYVNDILWDSDTYYYNTTFSNILLPTYSKIRLQLPETSGARYFDAWYLQDLGISDSYDVGYDVGYYDGEEVGYIDGLENSNFLITAVESLIGMMVNFTFIIFSLEIFGVNILMIIGVLFGVIAITWILKTIRG
jgi:hypothetical protein